MGLQQFPAGVQVWEAILEPGDTLYIPAFWFHTVQALLTADGAWVW
jgi:ribosomal protein L16 Arg81 hydroxylase